MEHKQYRDALLKMWDYAQSEHFTTADSEILPNGEEYTTCGLCNPEYGGAYNKAQDQVCPFDKRKPKDDQNAPCMDSCAIFIYGLNTNRLTVLISKFIMSMLTKEALASIKSLAKAGRGMKGVSSEAAANHVVVTNKMKKQIRAFGGFDFKIEGDKIKASRSEV